MSHTCKGGQLPPELEGNERLKNTEPRMVELILNEVCFKVETFEMPIFVYCVSVWTPWGHHLILNVGVNRVCTMSTSMYILV